MEETISGPEGRGNGMVLIENADAASRWADANLLARAGYQVVTCPGPELLGGGGCPLVGVGACAKTTEADIVLFQLDTDEANDLDVLRALRRVHPKTPLVVELTPDEATRLAAEVEGCGILPGGSPSHRLVEAVATALSA